MSVGIGGRACVCLRGGGKGALCLDIYYPGALYLRRRGERESRVEEEERRREVEREQSRHRERRAAGRSCVSRRGRVRVLVCGMVEREVR